jgi:hypothetical protein
MSDPTLARLRAADPATTGADDASRDARILARVLAAPPSRHRRLPVRFAVVTGVAALIVLTLALGIGRERSGDDFSAAAATYRTLTREAVLYHFSSVSRMTSKPAGVAQSYTTPAAFPPVRFDQTGAPQYHEVWLTPGGAAVRWLAYRSPGGRLLHAFAFRQDPRKLVGAAFSCKGPGCPAVRLPASDPATAFRQAYKDGRVRSRGSDRLDGATVWRFVSRMTGAGSYQEWLVDPETRLPLRYRYVDQNHQAGVPFTTRLTIRLTKFDVLPLNSDTRMLLRLTPHERELCLTAEHDEVARTRAYLRAHGRRVPPDLGHPLRSCR